MKMMASYTYTILSNNYSRKCRKICFMYTRISYISILQTNCDFETAILHYIDGKLDEYIFRIGRSCEASKPNVENIFSSNAF